MPSNVPLFGASTGSRINSRYSKKATAKILLHKPSDHTRQGRLSSVPATPRIKSHPVRGLMMHFGGR